MLDRLFQLKGEGDANEESAVRDFRTQMAQEAQKLGGTAFGGTLLAVMGKGRERRIE